MYWRQFFNGQWSRFIEYHCEHRRIICLCDSISHSDECVYPLQEVDRASTSIPFATTKLIIIQQTRNCNSKALWMDQKPPGMLNIPSERTKSNVSWRVNFLHKSWRYAVICCWPKIWVWCTLCLVVFSRALAPFQTIFLLLFLFSGDLRTTY